MMLSPRGTALGDGLAIRHYVVNNPGHQARIDPSVTGTAGTGPATMELSTPESGSATPKEQP